MHIKTIWTKVIQVVQKQTKKMCILYICLYNLTCSHHSRWSYLSVLSILAAVPLLIPRPVMSSCYDSAHKPSLPFLSKFSPYQLPPLTIHPTIWRGESEPLLPQLCSTLFSHASLFQTSGDQGLICSSCCPIPELRIVPWTYIVLKICVLIKCYIYICVGISTYIFENKTQQRLNYSTNKSNSLGRTNSTVCFDFKNV